MTRECNLCTRKKPKHALPRTCPPTMDKSTPRDSARDMAEQYNDNPKTLKHDRTHILFSRVGSTTLRSTARQTCQCPRRFSKACATNPAWAHKTYPPARRSMLVRNEHCLTASDTRVRITATGHASSKESRAASCSHGLLFSQSHF